jgi:hypothetical protein
MNDDQEFYVIEAMLHDTSKPLDEQVLEYCTYAVCEDWQIAREIELKDGPHGRKDFLKSRILGPFPLQTKELI